MERCFDLALLEVYRVVQKYLTTLRAVDSTQKQIFRVKVQSESTGESSKMLKSLMRCNALNYLPIPLNATVDHREQHSWQFQTVLSEEPWQSEVALRDME